MSELEFNFDIPAIKSAAEKEAEKAARKVARANAAELKRHQQRKETKHKQEVTAYRKSKVGLLERVWQSNFDALSDEDKSAIEALHVETLVNWSMAVDAIENIVSGNTDRAPFIDLVYLELKNVPKTSGYPNIEVAARMDAEDFENQDDDNFKRYGRLSKIPGALGKNFLHWAWQWAQTHKEDCQPDVYAELCARFARPEPIPTQSVGYKSLTKNEEAGLKAHRSNVQKVQQAMQEQL